MSKSHDTIVDTPPPDTTIPKSTSNLGTSTCDDTSRENTIVDRGRFPDWAGVNAICIGISITLVYMSYAINSMPAHDLNLWSTQVGGLKFYPQIAGFWLQTAGLVFFLIPVGRGFAQYLARLREQSLFEGAILADNKNKQKATEGLIDALNTERGHLQVGSWWVFNVALVVLAFGVGLASRNGMESGPLFAPVALVAFSSALLTTFWFMRRRVAFLADRIYMLRAHFGGTGSLAQLQTFFTPYQAPDMTMVKTFDSARKIVDYARELISVDHDAPRQTVPGTSAATATAKSGDNLPSSTSS